MKIKEDLEQPSARSPRINKEKSYFNKKFTQSDDEEVESDVSFSFKKLSITTDHKEFKLSKENFDKEKHLNKYTIYRDKYSDSESADPESESDEDNDYEAKGPGRQLKKCKEQRLKNAPYSENGAAYLNHIHQCGGHVKITDNYLNVGSVNTDFFFPSYQDFSSDYDNQGQKEVITENLIPNNLDQLVNEFLSQVSVDEKEKLFSALKSAQSLPDLNTYDLTDITNDDSQSTIDNNNYESGYDSCSPRSSAHSPSSYRASDSEASPIHENDSPNYIFPTPNLPVPGRTIKKPSSSWNIPCRNSPESRSLPPSPTPIHRMIRPEPTPVYNEREMCESAAQRIKLLINRHSLEIEWIRVLMDNKFTHISVENETKLMDHIRRRPKEKFFEVLHSILERIRKEKLIELIRYTNPKGESALTVATKECYEIPIVARYIVEVLTDLGENPDQVDQYGNSKIIYELILGGDKYVKVLAELLNAKIPSSDKKVFNVNRKNERRHETALHLAVITHSEKVSTLAITKLLVGHMANVSIQDIDGMTPIHLAVKHSCDPLLMKALLSSVFSPSARDASDFCGETALHYAANRSDISPDVQYEVMRQLVESGWNLKCEDINKKTPISLLPDSRKVIKDRLMRK